MGNQDRVLYILKELGGDTGFKHIEDIACRAWENNPTQFGWMLEKYSYPDKNRVYEALKHLKKAGFVCQNRFTWMLTPKGIAKTRTITINPRQFQLDEVRKTKLWAKYCGKKKWRDEFLFRDMLNVSPDSPQRVAKAEFQLLVSKAASIGDVKVITFLQKCSRSFTTVIGDEE